MLQTLAGARPRVQSQSFKNSPTPAEEALQPCFIDSPAEAQGMQSGEPNSDLASKYLPSAISGLEGPGHVGGVEKSQGFLWETSGCFILYKE